MVVTHGITKHSDKVPPVEIEKALSLKRMVLNTSQNPIRITGSRTMSEKKRSSDAVEWACNHYIKGDPEMEHALRGTRCPI